MKNTLKKLWKSRTVWLGGIISTIGVLEASATAVIPEEYRGHALLAMGIAVVWLRLLTTQPVDQK